jgi:hypothetical protein
LSNGTQDELLLAARAIAHGDRTGARVALTSVANRADPGSPTPDITLARARLWLAAGDSSNAAKTLDTAFDAVISYGAIDMTDPVNAGALISMMLLRAQLAAAKSDPSTAGIWKSATTTLWASADFDLRQRLKNAF